MILVATLVVSDPVYYGSPVATAGRPVTSRVDTGHRDSGWLIPASVCVWELTTRQFMTCPVFPRSLVKNPNSSLPGSQDVSYNSFAGLLGNSRYNYSKYKTDQSTDDGRTLFINSQFCSCKFKRPKSGLITFYFILFTVRDCLLEIKNIRETVKTVFENCNLRNVLFNQRLLRLTCPPNYRTKTERTRQDTLKEASISLLLLHLQYNTRIQWY